MFKIFENPIVFFPIALIAFLTLELLMLFPIPIVIVYGIILLNTIITIIGLILIKQCLKKEHNFFMISLSISIFIAMLGLLLFIVWLTVILTVTLTPQVMVIASQYLTVSLILEALGGGWGVIISIIATIMSIWGKFKN